MGFMTEVSILNDQWGSIKKNPEAFVRAINDVMVGRPKWGGHSVIGQATVFPSHHADDMRVYIAHQNSFVEAYPVCGMDLRELDIHKMFLRSMLQHVKFCLKNTENAILIATARKEKVS